MLNSGITNQGILQPHPQRGEKPKLHNRTSTTGVLQQPIPGFGSTPNLEKIEDKMASGSYPNTSAKDTPNKVGLIKNFKTMFLGKKSSANNWQQETNYGAKTDTHKTGTTRVSNEVTQEVSNHKSKDVSNHIPTKEQPELSEAQSKQYINSLESWQPCQEITLDNERMPAKSALPETVEQNSESHAENTTVSESIIERCKTDLVSLAEDKLGQQNSSTEENQLSTQDKRNKNICVSGEKLKRKPTQQSLSSTTSRTLNEYEELEAFQRSLLNKKPLEGVYDETNGNSHKKRSLTSKKGVAHNSEVTKKLSKVRQKVTPIIASRSSVPLKKHPLSSHTKETGTDNLKKFTGTDKLNKFKVLQPYDLNRDFCGIVWKYYGVCKSRENEKVIILIGGSESGKTTLVNFIANYLKGVQVADEQIILLENTYEDGLSPTKSITAYTFCFHENDVAITVIDTPGLSDGEGKEREDSILALKTLLANTNFKIHAIGLVVPSNSVHLTSSERLVIDDIFKHFGETVTDHIITFITFADNLETPPAIDVLESHGVRSKVVLQFNNSVMSDSKPINDFDKIFWRKGIKNLRKCIAHLEGTSPLSLNTLKATQLEAFSATVTKTSKSTLREVLTHLIHLLQVSTVLTEENLAMCDRVWEAATVLHRVISTSGHVAPGVEGTLLTHTKKVAKELNYPLDYLVAFLSLTSSRGLLSAGKWTIRSLAPLYSRAITTHSHQSSGRMTPESQYCKRCKKFHVMVRHIENGVMNHFPFLYIFRESKDITYKCSNCPCPADCHEECWDRKPQPLKLDPDWLLHHTRVVIQDLLEKFSLPDHIMDQRAFLRYINDAQSHEFHTFIEELASM